MVFILKIFGGKISVFGLEPIKEIMMAIASRCWHKCPDLDAYLRLDDGG
jgi:hypothetical protein